MRARTIDVVKTVLVCPGCDFPTEYSTDHLWDEERRVGQSWGPWYCDNCGVGFTGTVLNGNGLNDIEIYTKSRQIPIYVLLKHEPGEACCSPIYIVLDTTLTISEGETFEQAAEGLDYLYEEHTCPTNWMRGDVVKIRYMGDSDPHGVFEFVAAVPKTEDLDDPFEAFADIMEKEGRDGVD